MCARPGGCFPPGLFYLLPAWYNSIKKQAEHRVSTLWQRAPGRPLAAEAFVPPDFLGKELTGDKDFTMAAYWRRKLAALSAPDSKEKE